MPFEHEPSERLIAAIGSLENQESADIPAIIDELGVDMNDPEFGSLTGVATDKTELLQNLAPMISFYFLADLLDNILDPAIPQITNSEGQDMEFMRLVYRLAEGVTPAQVRAALNRRPELDAASETFWNWLEPKKVKRVKSIGLDRARRRKASEMISIHGTNWT